MSATDPGVRQLSAQSGSVAVSAADLDRQYVTVGVDHEVFALDVAHVREVLDLQPFTRVPHMPPMVRGMIDVRGRSLPVFDMRAKFGLPPAEPTPQTRIVVLEVPSGDHTVVLGALTDRVFEVTALDATGVEGPPDIGLRWSSSAILGIGRRHGQLVIILDLAHVFSTQDLSLVAGQHGAG